MNLNSIQEIKKINEELEKLTEEKNELENKLLELNRKIKNNQRLINANNRTEKWRERNHMLIEYGSLLEIAGLLEKEKVTGLVKLDKSTLLGYFLKFFEQNEQELDSCKLKGQLEFKKREEKKKKIEIELKNNRKRS